MKKPNVKARKWAIRTALAHRQRTKGQRRSGKKGGHIQEISKEWRAVQYWLKTQFNEGYLDVKVRKKYQVDLTLPENLNFSADYEQTALYFLVIRKIVSIPKSAKRTYKLKRVIFDNIKSISTSASLVLTAELSRWEDHIRAALTPQVDQWDPAILAQLYELGFFALFSNCNVNTKSIVNRSGSFLRLAPYIKGAHGDVKKRSELKSELERLVGDNIDKWHFLSSGLSEAITNVTHHAYPPGCSIADEDKTWYMGGSYNKNTKELRIVFYDQGVGIPASLPASQIWERVLEFFSRFSITGADRKKDAVLLRAAVEYERTSTMKSDRGKGLQDLLIFVKQRKNGYLSILSQKGLFKFAVVNGNESTKIESFKHSIEGTLIIWKVKLDSN